MSLRSITASLAMLIAALLPAAAEESEAASPSVHRPVLAPDGSRIAFMSDRYGEWELFVMSLDGQNVERLTDHDGWDGYAVWSPDGTRLIYDRGEGKDIATKHPYVMDVETGETRMLKRYDTWVSAAAWVTDNKLIGFQEREKDGDRDLVWIDAKSGDITSITDTPNVSESGGSLTPDKTILYFASSRDGESAMESLNLRTGERQRLLDAADRIYGIALSPDGKRIVYNDTPEGEENAEIYVYDLASGETARLTHNDAWDHMGVWTPDGAMLIFTSYRSGREEPYLLNPASGDTYRLSFD